MIFKTLNTIQQRALILDRQVAQWLSQFIALTEFLEHDIDEKNPCEKDDLLEWRIWDQDSEPLRNQLNRKNYKDLEWVFCEDLAQYWSAHAVGKLPKTKQKPPKRSWGNSSRCSHRSNQTEGKKKKKSQLTGHQIKHLESLLRQNWL